MSPIAMALSLLGLVPFIVFGLGAVGPVPDTAERMLISLIDYAGLLLAFGGGVYWGLALVPGSVQQSLRFGLGVLPLVVAWIGLVLAQLVAPSVALAVLVVAYLATVFAEHRAARRLLVPPRHVWLRLVFSAVAVVMMVMVIALRGLGQTIVF